MAQSDIQNGTKKSTGRKCSICSHEKVKEINSAINENKSFRVISRQILGNEKHHDSIQRHTTNCLNLEIQALIKEKKIENAIDHYKEISDQLEFARDLRIAAREYLSDPETGKLILIPRAREVTVIYEDYDDLNQQGEPKKKRENLDALLEKLEGVRQFQIDLLKLDFQRISEQFDNEHFEEIKTKIARLLDAYNTDYINAIKTEIKHVDIRQYALHCIQTVDTVLDKIAKKEGLYLKEAENPNEFSQLKKHIESVANKHGTNYQEELKIFLDNFSADIKPEIKSQLSSELVH